MNNLIGRKCKGFKFEDEEIAFAEGMEYYVGKTGEISNIIENKVRIEFLDTAWIYPLNQIEEHLISEIPEIKEGVLMEVSNYEDFEESYEENVLLMYKNRFVALDEEGLIYAWKYGRKIKQKVTLTKQEIADKFNIDINQLIIE